MPQIIDINSKGDQREGQKQHTQGTDNDVEPQWIIFGVGEK